MKTATTTITVHIYIHKKGKVVPGLWATIGSGSSSQWQWQRARAKSKMSGLRERGVAFYYHHHHPSHIFVHPSCSSVRHTHHIETCIFSESEACFFF